MASATTPVSLSVSVYLLCTNQYVEPMDEPTSHHVELDVWQVMKERTLMRKRVRYTLHDASDTDLTLILALITLYSHSTIYSLFMYLSSPISTVPVLEIVS